MSSVLSSSKLSRIIRLLKRDRDSDTSRKLDRSGWTSVKINGVSPLPAPLSQGDSEMCVVYSLLTIFTFQRSILLTSEEAIQNYVPSEEFLIDSFLELRPKDQNIDKYYEKLQVSGILDQGEWNNDTMNKTVRFGLEYDVIYPNDDRDWADRTVEAIKLYGGVIAEYVVTTTENKPIPVTVGDEKRDLGHSVFVFGYRWENGRPVFKFIDTYGRRHGNPRGRGEIINLDSVYTVYVPQLQFKHNGF